MDRSILKFENAIKSEATRKYYNYYLNKFVSWAKLKNASDLLQLKDTFLQEMVEDYLFYLKKTISPNSLGPRFAAIELFFTMNDKVLNFKKIRKMFGAKVKKTGEQAYTTRQVQKMLENAKTKRIKAIVHLLASTGCRIGALSELKMKHIRPFENCTMITFYEKSPEEYIGFLTPEATEAIANYFDERKKDGEMFQSETPVFRTVYSIGSAKAKPMSTATIETLVYRLVTENVERVKSGKRFNIQMDHGFRKRFNSTLKENDHVNISLAEKLMSHTVKTVQLDTEYHTPNPDKLFSEFKKHIFYLTVNESERQKLELQQAKQKLSELEFYKQKLAEMDGKYRDIVSKPIDDRILLEKIKKWKDAGLI